MGVVARWRFNCVENRSAPPSHTLLQFVHTPHNFSPRLLVRQLQKGSNGLLITNPLCLPSSLGNFDRWPKKCPRTNWLSNDLLPLRSLLLAEVARCGMKFEIYSRRSLFLPFLLLLLDPSPSLARRSPSRGRRIGGGGHRRLQSGPALKLITS